MFDLWKHGLFVLLIVVALTAAASPARLHAQAGPDVSCADANGDAVVNLSDVVSILDYLFLGEQEPMCRGPVLSCGDVNADDEVDLSDAVWLLQWLFLGGPAPLCVGGARELEGFTLLGANEQGLPEYRHEDTGIVFVLLPGGTLSAFLIAKYEVTQGEWEAVMGENPSRFQGDQVPPGVDASRLPVEEIWWFDMERFSRKTGFTLPTAAQWEYACRAGTEVHSGTENLDDMAWYADNSGRRPHEVGTKQANQFGLHDMLGNVWEVSRDRHDSLNGGSFISAPDGFHGGVVSGDVDSCFDDIGFRPVRPFHQEIELRRDWLAPGRLDFGYVVLGHSASLRLDIQNLGALPLELERITLSPQTSSEFEIEASPGAVLILPGESVEVKILYAPTKPGEAKGALVIESNDADEGSRSVPVHGAGSEVMEAPDLDDFTSLGPNDQGYPEYRRKDTGIVFVLLPGGTFWMGAQSADPDGRNYDPDASETERPVHEVTLSPFLIAKYEVTQGEWEAVMGENPSRDQGAWLPPGVDTSRLPVEGVSWFDVQEFEEETDLMLPTEAQWEYACRAGTEGAYSGTGIPGEMGWLARVNTAVRTHIVGGKQPNQFGLYDMHGNVSEWCEDVWDRSFYSNPDAAGPDPVSTTGSDRRVIRGDNIWILPLGSGHRTSVHESRDPSFTGVRPAWPLRQ